MVAPVLAAIGKDIIKSKAIEYSTDKNNRPIIIAVIIAPVIMLLSFIFIGISLIAALLGSFHTDIDKLAGAPTAYGSQLLGEYLPIFQQAQEKYSVSWAVLGAIGDAESSLGTYPVGVVSPAGAVGFMQFMPGTWSGWTNPKAENDAKTIIAIMKPYNKNYLPTPDGVGMPYDTNPETIIQYGGYGTDGDGDGYADPFNPTDAIFSAAKYIKANLNDGNYEQALYRYNASRRYVNDILEQASALASYQIPVSTGEWPVDPKWPITATFGQINPKLWANGHTGLDIACPEGSPVHAVCSGQIISLGPGTKIGNAIALSDNNGTIVRYFHLSGYNTTFGQFVEQGDVIGFSGSSGNSTGSHLHIEVAVNGQNCDPLAWLQSPGKDGIENY